MLGAITMDITDLTERIRRIIIQHGHLDQAADRLTENTDLFGAGMTSHACVNVMLALESEFDFEFPDRMLTRVLFCTITSIRAAIAQLDAATRITAHHSSGRHGLATSEG
jgi:acyl carrier protein